MDRDGWEQQQKDIIPEGSCVVFLKKWIQNEDFAFLPITFLYTEEFILWEYLQIKGYSSLYDPILQVHHIGGATTNELLKTNVPKAIRNKRRSLKWHMDSCKSYLKYKKKIEKMKRN
jgi:GT2 family glycosyltransferase